MHGFRWSAVSLAAALLMAVPAATAQAAAAKEPVYRLLGFALRGSTRIDGDKIVATLPQHEGDVITPAEMRADTAKIRAALAAAHVHGELTTATLEREGKGHWIWVVWDIHLADALSYIPSRGPRHLLMQSFQGNTKLTEAQLVAATGLHPGDPLPDGKISDARTGIEQAYDKALHGAPVTVAGKISLNKDNAVQIRWTIAEPQ